MDRSDPVLVPGATCWRVGEADRVACVVDAADYFSAAKSALLQARHRVMLIGWDFDTRIRLNPREPDQDVPDELGELLRWLVDHRPELQIHVLRWNLGAFSAVARGMLPTFVQDMISGRRLHYRVDAAHPVAAAHHQKIAVIDDVFAFCGGIDITVDRWDTSAHTPGEPHRTDPDGEPHGPWHDVTLALDGEAARVVADVAYDRWHAATGQRLPPVVAADPIWPEELRTMFEHCEVGVSRTLPEYRDREKVDEIRRLYLAAIAAARESLYIESQYLASREIAEAMAARLAEPDGPEIVLVLPRNADGVVERSAMDGARYRLLRMLWRADAHDRFRAYYPVDSDGEPIYVHAKVLIADRRLLRIGSSNLNNRSLGFDSECDVTIDLARNPDGAERFRPEIAAFRSRLIAEHLGVPPAEFDAELAARGSLIGAIEARRGPGKSLHEFDRATTEGEDSALAENELLDPEDVPAARFERIYRTALRYVR